MSQWRDIEFVFQDIGENYADWMRTDAQMRINVTVAP